MSSVHDTPSHRFCNMLLFLCLKIDIIHIIEKSLHVFEWKHGKILQLIFTRKAFHGTWRRMPVPVYLGFIREIVWSDTNKSYKTFRILRGKYIATKMLNLGGHCNQLEHLTESYAQIISSLHAITYGYQKSVEAARETRSHLMNITGK